MAKAIALAQKHVSSASLTEIIRVMLVGGCGMALVFAGPALPL